MDNENKNDVDPGVRLAYPLALESYEWAARRLDMLESRTQTILALGTSLTLAVPIGFYTMKLSVDDLLFTIAGGFFILALVFGAVARLRSKITIITPRVLYEGWLNLSEQNFKKELIRVAGDHLDKNNEVIEKMHFWLAVTTVMFFLEILALVSSVFVDL
jgi:hypothetical protein